MLWTPDIYPSSSVCASIYGICLCTEYVCVCVFVCVGGIKDRTCMLLLPNATRHGRLPLIPGFRQLLHPELQGCRKRSLLFPQDARRKTRFCMLTVHATIFVGGGEKRAFETRTFFFPCGTRQLAPVLLINPRPHQPVPQNLSHNAPIHPPLSCSPIVFGRLVSLCALCAAQLSLSTE